MGRGGRRRRDGEAGRGAGTPTSPYPHKYRRKTAIRQPLLRHRPRTSRPARCSSIPDPQDQVQRNCTLKSRNETMLHANEVGSYATPSSRAATDSRRSYIEDDSALFLCDVSPSRRRPGSSDPGPDKHRARVASRHGASCTLLGARCFIAEAGSPARGWFFFSLTKTESFSSKANFK